MDNQHKLISGYRDLNKAEIDLMNEIKGAEATVNALSARITGLPAYPTPPSVTADLPSRDAAVCEVAKQHLMIGLMLLTRSIAKPGAVSADAPVRLNDSN